MRGTNFVGSLVNGDWVEADGDWRPGDILNLRALKNLSTGAEVRATFQRARKKRVILLVAFVIWVIGVASIVLIAYKNFS